MQSVALFCCASDQSQRCGSCVVSSKVCMQTHWDAVNATICCLNTSAGIWHASVHECLTAAAAAVALLLALLQLCVCAGDANVPAGELTWRAAAAPLPTPWPEQEQQMVALRSQMVAVTAESAEHMAEIEAEDEAAGNVIAALMQQDDEPVGQHAPAQGQQQGFGGAAGGAPGAADWGALPGQEAGAEGAGMLAGGIAGYAMQQAAAHIARIQAWAADMQARRVVAIHKGEGQIANRGFKDPSWVEGRLWVYEDGTCGFVYMVRPHVYHLIDLERLDNDL